MPKRKPPELVLVIDYPKYYVCLYDNHIWSSWRGPIVRFPKKKTIELYTPTHKLRTTQEEVILSVVQGRKPYGQLFDRDFIEEK